MNRHAVVEDKEDSQIALEEPSSPPTIRPAAPMFQDRALFEDSLLEASSGQRKRRTWATIFSIILQCFLVGVLILVPLWFTDVLPKQQLLTLLEAPPPPPPAASASAVVKVRKVASDIMNGQLRTPSRIPTKVQMIKEAEAPPMAVTGGVVGGVPGGIPGGQLGGVIGGIISSGSSPAPVPALPKTVPTVQRVRVSQGVTQRDAHLSG